MNKSYSKELAELLTNLRYEQIPQEAIDQVKRITLHVIGASIGAVPIDQTKKTVEITQRKGGTEEATIWCSNGKKVPMEEAAFANGTIADIMDWEDCSWTGHPSAGAIPAALAVAEAKNLSGKDFILAVVAAYEGYQRIAMAAQPSRDYVMSGQGWGLVSWQIFSASIAAAKLMGLNSAQMEQVFGASLYNAIVACNKHGEGLAKSDIYHYAHGFCARNGVVSAILTKEGFDNCYRALDDADGFWHMVSDQCDWEWHTKEFGTRWLINETYLKHWPANMWVQTPLEALDRIMKRTPFKKENVKAIRVSPTLPFICGDYSKTTRGTLDAQFSIAYCLTAYIMDPKMSAAWFSEEMRNNRELIDFTTKFSYFGESRIPYDNFAIFKRGDFPEVTVEIELNDGSVLTETMSYPKGHPKNNFTLAEEYDHFRMCCGPYMSSGQIEKMIAFIDTLETAESMRPFAEMGAIR
ncbi:MmgE/PrpD family protein [Breznakiella homolactica]|uniref:MmgE/PrpD family protein n=1 Tax=Breznakiella homolactica TaxID=2798577 RepID=A0A7T7XQY5_9SPIR|nr:MmgE/PrpD family protein [Breznakiella homolactica]QQO10768.1 MmgE/PrpD family protein [Breznakiella homolactica]